MCNRFIKSTVKIFIKISKNLLPYFKNLYILHTYKKGKEFKMILYFIGINLITILIIVFLIYFVDLK